MSPTNFSAATSASVMGMLSLAYEAQAENGASAFFPEGFSLASLSSSDKIAAKKNCSSWQDGFRVKNTFVHLDRRLAEPESDDELALPIKCKSAPALEACPPVPCLPDACFKSPKKPEIPEGVLKGAKTPSRFGASATPKVTFDLSPSFFSGDVETEDWIEHVSKRVTSETSRSQVAEQDSVKGTDSESGHCVNLSQLSLQGSDLPLYEVKNTFIQFDKSSAVDSEMDLPTRSISLPSMSTTSLSPTAGPAKVCLESLSRLTSDMQLSGCEYAPSSPGTPAKVWSKSEGVFPAELTPKAPPGLPITGLPLSLRCAPRTTSLSSLEFWSSPDSECGGSSVTSSFRIKNTFVHVDMDGAMEPEDDADLALPMKCASSPALMHEQTAPPTAGNGLPSVGAALHSSGQCKPCAWFWKPSSCQWGAECCHCHMCPEGELRRRKKERKEEVKATRAALREQEEATEKCQ